MAAHFVRRYVPEDTTTILPQSLPTACAPAHVGQPKTITIQHALTVRRQLATSVHTWLPRSTDDHPSDSSPPQPPKGHHRHLTSPLELMTLVFIMCIFAGLLLYFANLGLLSCCKRRRKGKDFRECAGESAKDRAARYKKFMEGKLEEGKKAVKDTVDKAKDKKQKAKKDHKDGENAIEENFKKAGKWIGKQEENAVNELTKAGEAVQGWAEDTGKKFKEFVSGNEDNESTALLNKKDKKGKKSKNGKDVAGNLYSKAIGHDGTDDYGYGTDDNARQWEECQIEYCINHAGDCGDSDVECGL